ncbi:uncharacterized protein LOC112493749 isoform X2 [Cephus cinctus]|uniref:Uncharacterized protein LOC112493749 isoform X2 n=1 Tax=Cephus cinctus TaxID=211228 RepID=A0AAJ7VX27_CEPCN|nr:uncharacterized protein LOC112493749 isoform X2 [Cephus cinctus]
MREKRIILISERVMGCSPFPMEIDYGIYQTENFDKYEATWDGDKIKHNFSVRYSNGMRYRGGIDVEGALNGHGIYTFPDGSSVDATWQENKPILNVIYREPLGFVWNSEYASGVLITSICYYYMFRC